MSDSTKRAVKSAKLRRKALAKKLGGACCECGAKRHLEFHHTHGRNWVANEVSRWTRIKLYERDYEGGLLKLLCRTCHMAV